MRVGFDTKDLLSTGHRAGAYFLELLPELLAAAHDDDELWVFRAAEDEESAALAWLLRDEKLHQLATPFRGRASSGLWRSLSFPAVERLVTPPGGRRATLDACHSIHPPLMPSRAGRKIVTLHQLDADSGGKLPATLRRSLTQADVVVTTSEAMERELRSRVEDQLPKKRAAIGAKTVVVHPGVHDRYRRSPKPTEIEALLEHHPFLEEPYLLAAGGASDVEHGVPFLAEACARAAQEDPSLPPLVVLAERDQSQSLVELLEERSLGGRARVVHELTLETLPALYRGAEFLLYPAHDFAFGLAVLEAAASGIPSIVGPSCGAIEVLPEATEVPADDTVEGWASSILEFHRLPARRQALGAQARERSAGSDWRQSAERHWQLYRGED